MCLIHHHWRVYPVRLLFLAVRNFQRTTVPNASKVTVMIFDAIFTLTPQFFAAGVSSATLIFSISPGPNVPC